MIDARLFERIRRMQERFDALCARLEQSYAGAPEELAMAEIEQASTLARRETADAWRAAGRLPAPPAAAAGPEKAARRRGGTGSAKARTTSKARR